MNGMMDDIEYSWFRKSIYSTIDESLGLFVDILLICTNGYDSNRFDFLFYWNFRLYWMNVRYDWIDIHRNTDIHRHYRLNWIPLIINQGDCKEDCHYTSIFFSTNHSKNYINSIIRSVQTKSQIKLFSHNNFYKILILAWWSEVRDEGR